MSQVDWLSRLLKRITITGQLESGAPTVRHGVCVIRRGTLTPVEG
jgi:hypothetical protein